MHLRFWPSAFELDHDASTRNHMRTRRRRLFVANATAQGVQLQSTLLGHFNRRTHSLSDERRNHNSTLLNIKHDRAAGWIRNRDTGRGFLLGRRRQNLPISHRCLNHACRLWRWFGWRDLWRWSFHSSSFGEIQWFAYVVWGTFL